MLWLYSYWTKLEVYGYLYNSMQLLANFQWKWSLFANGDVQSSTTKKSNWPTWNPGSGGCCVAGVSRGGGADTLTGGAIDCVITENKNLGSVIHYRIVTTCGLTSDYQFDGSRFEPWFWSLHHKCPLCLSQDEKKPVVYFVCLFVLVGFMTHCHTVLRISANYMRNNSHNMKRWYECWLLMFQCECVLLVTFHILWHGNVCLALSQTETGSTSRNSSGHILTWEAQGASNLLNTGEYYANKLAKATRLHCVIEILLTKLYTHHTHKIQIHEIDCVIISERC